MKYMTGGLRVALIAFAIVMASGCAFLQKNVVPVAKDLTTKYCAVPEEERLVLRSQVNQAIAPNSIVVTCAVPPSSAVQ